MFDFWHNPSGLLDETASRRLARRLVKASESWTRAFLRCVDRDDPALGEALTNEVMAYAVCLFEMRLTASPPAQVAAFVADLRSRCREARWRNSNLRSLRPLPAPKLSGDASEFTRRYLALATSGRRDFEFTAEIWQEFSQTTGLGSSVLVGSGSNLASLVFYIVVHSRVFATGPACREKMSNLLRTARDCGRFFDDAFSQWGTGADLRLPLPDGPRPPRIVGGSRANLPGESADVG